MHLLKLVLSRSQINFEDFWSGFHGSLHCVCVVSHLEIKHFYLGSPDHVHNMGHLLKCILALDYCLQLDGDFEVVFYMHFWLLQQSPFHVLVWVLLLKLNLQCLVLYPLFLGCAVLQ